MINAANPPGVVITDMIMPGKSGLEVVSEIRRLHPTVKIIAISGGGRIKENDDMLEKAGKLGADMTLAKPLDLDKLEEAVLKLLG
jgi:DNA-binding NarL/FixJ family response regulator